MKILVACDKFKGSLSAIEACEAVAGGLDSGAWKISMCPIADGGEGFAETMLAACGGAWVDANCLDPLGRPVTGGYGLSRGGESVAFIEMSSASGLWRVEPCERDLFRSSTWGTGQLIRHAVEVSGAERIVIGIGGSATNDGGAGMAAALGVSFLNASGAQLFPAPSHLADLAVIDVKKRIPLPHIVAACDVDHPLTGVRGASAVFGPQKGASAKDIPILDSILARLAEVSGRPYLAETPGAGAAGGLGFGLLCFADAILKPGFEVVASAIGLEERIRTADLVVTGEGSLDFQTLGGKGPAGVAAMAKTCGVPVVAVAGRVEPEARSLFDYAISLEDTGLPVEACIARAAELVSAAVRADAGLLMRLASR